ncbi:MAG: type II secretion system protein J [Candidatus Saccharimonadia bacterium]
MSRLSQQHGYTLLELIIVVVITSMLTLVLGTFLVNSLNTFQYATAQTNSANDVLGILDRVGKVVRGATKVVSTGTSSLTIYGYFSPRDSVPDQITYAVSGTTFQSTDIPASGTGPNYTYNAANGTTKTLTSNLAVGSTPIFTYYDDLGNQLTGSFTTGQVKQIGIYIAVNPQPARVPIAIGNQIRVSLRNMKTNL